MLVEALAQVAGPDGAQDLTVAGRTDAGVHATGQVAHVDLTTVARQRLGTDPVRRLAGVLPADVRVLRVAEVGPEFDARFSALARRYAYRVADTPYGVLPLRRRDTLAWPRELDLELLRAAAAGLVGEHDFAAYCRRNPHGTSIREVLRLDWRRDGDGGPGVVGGGALVATVVADAFCQAMVRSLVGAMLLVGDGRRPPTWPAELLARRERAGEIRVAPARGLTLVGVDYPADPAQWAARAALTRTVRTLASA